MGKNEESGDMNRAGKDKSANISDINIQWDVNNGTCSFENLPVTMMWINSTLKGLMAGVQYMVGTRRFALALQGEGRKSVEEDWGIMSGYPDFESGFEAIANIAAVAGWGRWRLVSIDRNDKKCVFRVHNSWEGRYQKMLGVSWGSGLLAGKMAGYCSKLFATNCWATQTSCIAEGDEYDEFVIEPSQREIEDEIENLLKSDDATRADMAVALKKLQEEAAERKKLIDELENKNAELENFNYTVSHDLKSPIITIKSFVSLLEKDVKKGDHIRVQHDIERISRATEQIEVLLEDLLELSRLGSVINPPEDVRLTDIINSAIERLSGRISEKKAEMIIHPDLPVISCDRERMVQVFQNLLENAIKFTEKGKIPRVEVTCVVKDEEVVCTVRDNGKGIDPTYSEKIFQIFHQLDPDDEGTGMGLAFIKRIIEAHGGRIWAESEGTGKGTVFHFTVLHKKTA